MSRGGRSRTWAPPGRGHLGRREGSGLSTVCAWPVPGQPKAAINGTDRPDSALAEERGAGNFPVLRPKAAAQPLPPAQALAAGCTARDRAPWGCCCRRAAEPEHAPVLHCWEQDLPWKGCALHKPVVFREWEVPAALLGDPSAPLGVGEHPPNPLREQAVTLGLPGEPAPSLQ